ILPCVAMAHRSAPFSLATTSQQQDRPHDRRDRRGLQLDRRDELRDRRDGQRDCGGDLSDRRGLQHNRDGDKHADDAPAVPITPAAPDAAAPAVCHICVARHVPEVCSAAAAAMGGRLRGWWL
ncbi:unnamed protein product, partial [Closterium sp. Naga37s-1]